ncbi:Zn-ribbon domain-containing protein [Methanogenium organophilum]|uniref:Zn-ribbon domain-containing protein n=1 Tax=Methanogenium organophilum TaxID=2199 RepID=A0A9X9T8L5_METOG|nr:Zn-ribbon domain-containing protein [Methanogenium organophilum]WAI01287.1 Zn-ribbon domain-containing protein [Methanogenium organophilum]
MAHKCTQCGREFQDGSNVILKGCPSCGGKKFLYIRPQDMHKDVLEEKSIKQIAEETKEQFLEITDDTKKKEPAAAPQNVEMYDRIESITVINPGSYELNLEKLAESDELVVRMGSDDRYMVDIHSMGKTMKSKTKGKNR